MRDFNTIALAYTNDAGEVVAWSSDTFGSPSKYPKTFKDNEHNVEMLSKKFNSKNEFLQKFTEVVKTANSFAGMLIESSNKSNETFFTKNGVTGTKLFKLDLLTDYKEGHPKWEDVVKVVDEKKYQIYNQEMA